MKKILNILRDGFKYLAPFFLILWPLVVLYDFVNPWPPSEQVLSKYKNEIVLLSGFHSNTYGSYKQYSRTYLIIKPDILTSKTVKITTESNGLHEVEEHEGGLIRIFASYMAFMVMTWWFWFRGRSIHS